MQLVGSDTLPEREQLTLEVARLIREFFLQQNAFHEVDTYSELKKTYRIMKSILKFKELGEQYLSKGVRIQKIIETKSKNEIGNARFDKDYNKVLDNAEKNMQREFAAFG